MACIHWYQYNSGTITNSKIWKSFSICAWHVFPFEWTSEFEFPTDWFSIKCQINLENSMKTIAGKLCTLYPLYGFLLTGLKWHWLCRIYTVQPWVSLWIILRTIQFEQNFFFFYQKSKVFIDNGDFIICVLIEFHKLDFMLAEHRCR